MKVTPLGWKVLKGEHQVSLVIVENEERAPRQQKVNRPSRESSIPVVHSERVIFEDEISNVEDKKLFEYLRKIRKNLADEQGYPPYIVLSDKSLHELTRMKPTTLQAFGLISGIGEFKIKKYGDTFIKAIKKYTGK